MEAKGKSSKRVNLSGKQEKERSIDIQAKNIIAYITTAKNAEQRERRLKTQKGNEINKKKTKAKQEPRKRT